jgi:hypothetical protein
MRHAEGHSRVCLTHCRESIEIEHTVIFFFSTVEEDNQAYDLSRLQKPLDADVDSLTGQPKTWPDSARNGKSICD